jgi:hypothetical protein
VTLSSTAKALAPPDERAGGPKLNDHGRHGGGRGGHGGPCPPGPVTKARRVTAVTAGAVIMAVTARGMQGPTITAVTAVTARSCPPSERHAVAVSRRGHGGHGGHGVSRRPSGWATPSAGSPAEAGQRRTTISHRPGGRAKSRSDERVSVTSTGGERHEEPCHVRKERSEEARNGWASGEVPAVTGRF